MVTYKTIIYKMFGSHHFPGLKNDWLVSQYNFLPPFYFHGRVNYICACKYNIYIYICR